MKTLLLLIALTLFTGWISQAADGTQYLALTVMGVAVVKLWLVAFNFMHLHRAHVFWKGALVVFSLSFLLTITLLTAH